MNSNVQVDFLNLNGGPQVGEVAQRFATNGGIDGGIDIGMFKPFIGDDGSAYRTLNTNTDRALNIRANAATLRKDEWKFYDTAVVEAALQRLVAVRDLMSRNLTFSVPNGLGKTVLEYEEESDITDAEMSMSAVSKSKNDRYLTNLKYLPLPIIHKDFQINIRALSASRERGIPMDTRNARGAARKVSDYAEDLLANGTGTFTYGGGSIYGYCNAPNRNTGSLAGDWSSSAISGEEILDDVIAMKQALLDDRHYGPYVLYIPANYETVLDEDFKDNSDKSLRQRLLEIDMIDDIKVIDKLDDHNVVLVEMQDETVRLVEGLPIQTVQWDTEGGMILHFKVMTIMVPQIRADYNSRSGIAHYTYSA